MRLTASNAVAGGLMAALGTGVLLEALQLGTGTLDRVGPGAFPAGLGACLAVVGILIALGLGGVGDHEAAGWPSVRGGVCIVAAVCMFVVLGERYGLGPATFGSVFVAALGDRAATTRSSLLLAAGATLVTLVVFSWLLKFQLPFYKW